VVAEVGSHVKHFKAGDRVYGLVAGGGYADYCCVNQHLAAQIPDEWDYGYAAAIPEALITAHTTVFTLGKLKKNQSFLIHAAGSGISCFAIQMARYIGAQIFTTASNQEKMAKAKQIGANTIINYKTEDFGDLIGEETIDLIIDYIGGSYFPKHLKLLKLKGRLVQIACMQGNRVECNLVALMKKRLNLIGFVLRSQSIAEKAHLWKTAQQHWSTPLLNKHVVPIIDSEFKFEELELAHSHMLSGAHYGKIIIRLD
jgi:NADPH:quinone reductase-like Zn-dependent oxidoreductase